MALYIVAYDIADPKRLKRVMRTVQGRASRRQKSVFLFEGRRVAVRGLLNDAARHMDLEEDCIEAWRIAPTRSGDLLRGTCRHIVGASVVIADAEVLEPAGDHETADDF